MAIPIIKRRASSTESEKKGVEEVGGPLPQVLGSQVEEDLMGQNVQDSIQPELARDIAEIPFKYRLVAFSMIIFFAFGSSFAENTLSPLKSTLKKELGINNAQYGALSAATNLVNTVLPIIGGIGMDHWGATYAALLSSTFILIGSVVSALSATNNHYQLLIAGRVILGLGSTIIEACQSKLYAHWFHGSWLACVFALDIAFNRITSIISKTSSVPMSNLHNWWGWALWIPSATCALNLGLVMMYWYFERHVPKQYQPPLGKEAEEKEGWRKRRFGLKTLRQIPMFFWFFCLTQVPQNAVVGVYSSNLPDIQSVTRGSSKLAAGYNSSLQGVIPIVLTPVIGAFFDRYGWRMLFVSATALLYILTFSLIGFSTVHPLVPILISSFALSSNALTFIASIPVLVGQDALLGTAFGIWKAFQNANTTILEVVAGAIQDLAPKGKHEYDNVLYMCIALKSVEVLWGPIYDYLDGIWLGHSLRMPERARLQFRKEVIEQGEPWRGWRIEKSVSIIAGMILSAMIITSFTLYIVYSLPR